MHVEKYTLHFRRNILLLHNYFRSLHMFCNFSFFLSFFLFICYFIDVNSNLSHYFLLFTLILNFYCRINNQSSSTILMLSNKSTIEQGISKKRLQFLNGDAKKFYIKCGINDILVI